MMGPERLKAFTDGVLAIIITIMVLELRAPHDAALSSLRPLVPVVLSYALSFVYLIIYWNNHHHLLHVCRQVTGGILWANAHLLFWLSLVPFVTAWMGENHFAPVPMAAYGAVLFLAGVAYWVLQRVIIVTQGTESALAAAVGRDMKGKLSPLVYAIAIPSGVVDPTHRGNGVGRMLLDATLDALKARGATQVVLSTAERNSSAQHLFERAGFRRTMIEMTRELADQD